MANSTALSMFDPAAVPEHIKQFNEAHGNIGDKQSVDSLTYKGKIWTVAVGGTKTPLMKRTDDGDEEPRSMIPLVILDYNKRRGRSYYATGFQEDKPQIPDCWSADGITPDKTSTAIQSDKCATCPMAVKGSKTTDAGQPTAACSQYRMVAVSLYKRWELPPLRLRLAITSDYDGQNKENEAKGWYAFQQLMDLLRARGVKHTGSVVVRAKFDSSKAYPKVLFSPVGWTTEEEIEIIQPLSESAEVAALLSPTFTSNGADGVKKDEPPAEEEPEMDAPAPKPATAKAGKPKPKASQPASLRPVPNEVEEEEAAVGDEEAVGDIVEEAEAVADEDEEAVADEDEDEEEAAAARAAEEAQRQAQAKQAAKVKQAQAEAAKRKAAAAAQPAADDDEGDVVVIPPKAAPKAAPKAPVAAAAPAKAAPKAPVATAPAKAAPKATAAAPKPVSPAVASTLADWSDDD